MKKDTVKKLYLGVVFFLLLCATCFSGCVGEEKAAQVDTTVYEWMDTELIDVVTGEAFTLRELTSDGTPIVVHLFATWCPACNMQLSESTAFLTNYPGKAHVVPIDIYASESPAAIVDHVTSRGYTGIYATSQKPVIDGLIALFGPEIMGLIPQTVFISGNDILYLGPGVVSTGDLAARLDAMLQQLTS